MARAVHPGVELVTRDRSATYAQAAAEGAPKAQQVADRWHLLKNLREAIERLLERQSDVVDWGDQAAETAANPPPSNPSADPAVEVMAAAESPSPQLPSDQTPESPSLEAQRARRRRRIERFEQVHERHRQGHSARRIARELGMFDQHRAPLPAMQSTSGLETGTGMASPAGQAPGMDRCPHRRGRYERVPTVSAINDKRFPRLVQQRAAIRQEAVGGSREEARACQRSEAI